MTEIDLNHPDVLYLVQRELNENAKFYWWIARVSEAVVLVIGILTIFVELSSMILFFLTTALTVTWFASQWHSDNIKQRAQYYLRKYEYWNGFGWKPDEQELRDTHIQLPNSIRKKVSKEYPQVNHFESRSKTSPKRAVENLEESSWWSKALAGSTFRIFLAISGILFALGIVTLIIALQIEATSQAIDEKIVRVVISIFVFAFSTAYLRTAVEHQKFSAFASRIEREANRLLKQANEPNDIQAVTLLTHYQIERLASPLIPTFIWRMRETTLNQSWQKYQRENK
jgi:hypothetical protein